ncbi:hypothetical protein ACQJBY_010625 [Aegilops geniculata]
MPITQFWVTPSIYLTKARGPGPRLDLWDIEAALVLSGWPNKMRKELNSERKGDDNDHEGQDNDEASVSKKQRVVWSGDLGIDSKKNTSPRCLLLSVKCSCKLQQTHSCCVVLSLIVGCRGCT